MEELTQEVASEPEVASPEPEQEEQEQSQEFDYSPSFLEGEAEPQARAPMGYDQRQDQQWSPQQVQAYNQYMRQQQQQQPQTPNTLDRFIQNPDGTISEIAGYTAHQVAQSLLAQSYGPMAAQMNEFVQGQARYHTAVADDKIRGMYKEKFAKDETFAGNKRIQARVDGAIRGLREQAIMMAHRGDPSGFQIFNNPTFAEATLALAKIIEGTKPGSSGSAPVPRVERTSPATKKQSIELDPDTEAAISRFGPDFRDRYLKAQEEQSKHNDFQG